MKNKGFTLMELIGVIVILGVVAVFSIPALTKTLKESAEKEYNEYVKNVTLAAENYFHTETDAVINGKYFIKVGTLLENGYLKKTVNPKTKEETSEDATVIISKNEDGTEKYDLVEFDATESGYQTDGLLTLYDGYNQPINGVWTDLSGNGNNGQVNGPSWSINNLSFDGINDYVQIDANSTFPSGNANYTLEIVIYCNELKGRNNLINLGVYDSPGNANGIYIKDSSKISHWYWSDDLVTDSILNSNTAYYITALYDGTNRKIYLNGKEVASDNSNPNVILGNITIGNEIPNQDGFFNGNVYSVRIYNRALTTDEINNNYMIDKYRFDI